MKRERLKCPIDGCPLWRRSDHAFCAEHWYQVPLEMRQRISRTKNGPTEAHRIAIVEAWEYLKAEPSPRIPESA